MSNIKALIMDNEEKFWDKACQLVSEFDNFQQFERTMYEEHYDLVVHLQWDDVFDNLHEYWNEFWDKHKDNS